MIISLLKILNLVIDNLLFLNNETSNIILHKIKHDKS